MAASGRVYPKLRRNVFDERCIHEVTANEAPPQTDEVYQLARVV